MLPAESPLRPSQAPRFALLPHWPTEIVSTVRRNESLTNPQDYYRSPICYYSVLLRRSIETPRRITHTRPKLDRVAVDSTPCRLHFRVSPAQLSVSSHLSRRNLTRGSTPRITTSLAAFFKTPSPFAQDQWHITLVNDRHR